MIMGRKVQYEHLLQVHEDLSMACEVLVFSERHSVLDVCSSCREAVAVDTCAQMITLEFSIMCFEGLEVFWRRSYE